MLAEVLTYLNKGLSPTGCPVAGMDKHEEGMFEILGPVSKEMAADKKNKKKNALLSSSSHCSHQDEEKERKRTRMFTDTPQISEHLHPRVALCCSHFLAGLLFTNETGSHHQMSITLLRIQVRPHRAETSPDYCGNLRMESMLVFRAGCVFTQTL